MTLSQREGPRITLEQARRSWFVYEGQAYAVKTCTTEQFKAFVGPLIPEQWRERRADRAELELLAQSDLDVFDRWFVLLALGTVPLYGNRECAENALRDKSERVAYAVV